MNQLQNTPEWEQARCGKLTASRFHEAIATLKGGDWGASREAYMAELICERLTGQPYVKYVSAAMQRGTELQHKALAAYEFEFDVKVELVGFVPHPTIPMCGASPDGLVGEHGMVEFKMPETHTHLSYIRAARRGLKIPRDYNIQMHWQMACCKPGRLWCDWVSYDPRLPERHAMLVRRVQRDDALIAKMEEQAQVFLAELEVAIADLENHHG